MEYFTFVDEPTKTAAINDPINFVIQLSNSQFKLYSKLFTIKK